jgi:hypothetical protein
MIESQVWRKRKEEKKEEKKEENENKNVEGVVGREETTVRKFTDYHFLLFFFLFFSLLVLFFISHYLFFLYTPQTLFRMFGIYSFNLIYF